MDHISKKSFQDIAIDAISPHPDNPRPKGAFKKNSPKMKELIASVEVQNILQPITVRKLPDDRGYQLIMGERRLTAARFAGLATVPALVREMTDEEAFAALLAENIQREDLDPVLMARTIAAYQKRGFDLATIAAKMGKSYSWVVQHAQIINLSESWCNMIAAGEVTWSIANLLLVARYSTEIQEALHKDLVEGRSWDNDDRVDLRAQLSRYHHDVSNAPWDTDDADLVPKAGACSACPKRTSCQKTLFETNEAPKGGAVDECVDHTCWNLKEAAHFARRETQLAAKHQDLVKISEQKYNSEADVLGYSAYERVTKRTDGAKPALIVDGRARGTLIYITGVNHARTKAKASPAKLARDAGKTPTKAQLRQELADKREALQRRRTLLAWSALTTVLERCAPERDAELVDDAGDGDPVVVLDDEAQAHAAGDAAEAAAVEVLPDLPVGVVPKVPALTAWAAIYGVAKSWTMQGAGTKWVLSLTEDRDLLHRVLWQVTAATMLSELKACVTLKQMDSLTPGLIAQLIKVDLDDLVRQATAAILEPKAWAVQYGDLLTEGSSEAPRRKAAAG